MDALLLPRSSSPSQLPFHCRLLSQPFSQGSTDRGSKLSCLLPSHLLQFDVTLAGGRYCSYLLPKQDGVMSNCSKWAICCNYLARILTPCPAYLCSLKYLGFNQSLTPIELAGVNDWLEPALSRHLA